MNNEKQNIFSDEYILCPKCFSSEKIKVLQTREIWVFNHKCSQCGTVMTQGNLKLIQRKVE